MENYIDLSEKLICSWHCCGNFANKWWLMELVPYFSRVLLQFSLLTLFVYFFGLPAIEKYQEKEVIYIGKHIIISHGKVIMVTSEKDTGGFSAPSVTVFPENGWRGDETMEKCY